MMKIAKRLAAAITYAWLVCGGPALASQSTLVTPGAPLPMTSLASFLNAALLSIGSCNAGNSAPANGPGGAAFAGECWINTTANPWVFSYTADGTHWTEFGTLNTSTFVWTPYSNGSALGIPITVAEGGTNATAAGATAANNIGALAEANNLSDLGSASSARSNLGLSNLYSVSAVAHQWIASVTAGVPSLTQPAFADISGTLASSQCPTPTTSALGCVEAINVLAHNWITSIDTSGVAHQSQPAFTDISGTALISQGGTSQTTAAAARGASGLDIDQCTATGSSAYTILSTDRCIYHTSLTGAVTDALPAASSFNAGQVLVIADFRGVASASHTITLSPNGSDTINGVSSLVAVNAQYGAAILWSDGSSR